MSRRELVWVFLFTLNVSLGAADLHGGNLWGLVNLGFAVGMIVIWLVSRHLRLRRERELARTGGYKNCRDFEHWKHWVDRVYEIHNELAVPLGMVLTINNYAQPGCYFLYLTDASGHRREVHGMPSAGTLLAGAEWADSVKDPAHGDRWLAEAITEILSTE